jgi:signal transduction histidine kinase
VDQYDGDIWIRETGPDGTTIVLALPLATARAAATMDPLRERQ